MGTKVTKTDAEWRQTLTPEQYRIARQKGTERAFSGEYAHTKDEGTYKCVCCGEPLFSSETKFESGTGWPSFYQPISDENVGTDEDNSFWMRRTEVTCKSCGAVHDQIDLVPYRWLEVAKQLKQEAEEPAKAHG